MAGVKKLISQGGNEIETFDEYKLCKCGESLDKPFCDGMHDFFEFNDEKDPYRTADEVDVYEGALITIYENRGVCSHRGFCYEDLPVVWKMTKGIRIDMSVVKTQEMVDKVIDICRRCPSGALSFSYLTKSEILMDMKMKGLLVLLQDVTVTMVLLK